ncbi:hypothetical protein HOLleu_32876 [Holothuria leucospilota]|uniref:Uncharacterized protein n=1 Tax=Holothuria leucospilota TaxID=206669 RepID=A0A9Q0YMS7_HOLLE|nr:hypothetical protein HOLleu_32876 [Holothuria leucospilota]
MTSLHWVYERTRRVWGNHVYFSKNLFLFGSPAPSMSEYVFGRILFIISVTKHSIWKSRCAITFDNKNHDDNVLISDIKWAIKDRNTADFRQWPESKFTKVWANGPSFVSLQNGAVRYLLP